MELWLILFIPPLLFMLYAQWRVSSTFGKYSKIPNDRNMTGLNAARWLLDQNNLQNVQVELSKGKLSDHYDPRVRVLRLSPDVANKASVAALGIVAHEVGHAVQHATAYAPLQVRNALAPVAGLGSNLGGILVFVGIILYAMGTGFGLDIAWIGVALFGAAVVFTMITLPVEFDASARARSMLRNTGLASVTESSGASAVLSAAALTYVAALLAAVGQLLYYVLILTGGRRD
ncbi:zinc metallopeptidase [Dehalogenimonas alkenigignens]|uniref:Putative Zn-dependent protease n=1 Tax=Dehalogenimonas alkenigignens TaxID=1217799 RepID=A0A0W0GGJ9_9CHLR|nr:zinc metallopeptidase [Dehalogenimonas alkenigignens]KTB47680.1 putative Zn-dependent protease [Dehalogenimonas alkenigignens]PVV84052.1 zinc metallopeptidase [Dehalogenimonas alkenigignens]